MLRVFSDLSCSQSFVSMLRFELSINSVEAGSEMHATLEAALGPEDFMRLLQQRGLDICQCFC